MISRGDRGLLARRSRLYVPIIRGSRKKGNARGGSTPPEPCHERLTWLAGANFTKEAFNGSDDSGFSEPVH